VRAATGPAQGFRSLGRSSFHFDGDHDFSLFLRSAPALRAGLNRTGAGNLRGHKEQ
jgi:hypothetical protein